MTLDAPPVRVVRSSAWLIASQGVSLGAGIAVSVLIARSLGPAGQGAYSLGVLIVALATLLVGQGVLAANIHFAGSNRFAPRDLGSHSGLVVVAGTLVCWLVLAVLAATGLLSRILPGVGDGVTLVAALAIPLYLTRQLAAGILTGRQLISRTALIDILQAVALAVLVVAAVAFHPDPSTAMAAYLAAGLVGAVAALLFLRTLGAGLVPRWRSGLTRPVLWYGVRSNLGTILQFVTYRLDFLLVNALAGTLVVGQYAVASRLAELLWVVPSAAGTVVFAARSRSHAGTTGTAQTIRAFWAAAYITALASCGLALLGPILVPVVYTASFADSVPALLIMVPGAALLGCSAILANDLAGRNRPGLVTIAAIVGFAATLVLDLALIPGLGMTGAAIASSVAYATYAVAVFAAFLRVTGTSPRTFVGGARIWRQPA